MRKILFGLLLFVSVINLSCTQDDEDCPLPTYPIEGLWIGTYNFSSGPVTGPQYYSFIIKPQGALIVETVASGVNYYASGTWSLNGTMLECKYTYPTSVTGSSLKQRATATFSNSGQLTNGNWANTDANWVEVSEPTQRGTFVMQRVN